MFLHQYRTQKTRYMGKDECWTAATRDKTISSTLHKPQTTNAMALIMINVSPQCVSTNETCRNINFQPVEQLCSLFTDYYMSWWSAHWIYVCWSIYMMADRCWLIMSKTTTVQLPGQYWHIIHQNECLFIVDYRFINFIRTIGIVKCPGRSN